MTYYAASSPELVAAVLLDMLATDHQARQHPRQPQQQPQDPLKPPTHVRQVGTAALTFHTHCLQDAAAVAAAGGDAVVAAVAVAVAAVLAAGEAAALYVLPWLLSPHVQVPTSPEAQQHLWHQTLLQVPM